MALSIKDPETERLARNLARLTGENITTATKRAIEERLRRVGGQSRQDLPCWRIWPKSAVAGARCRSWITGRRTRSSVMTSMDYRADGDRHIRDRGNCTRRT